MKNLTPKQVLFCKEYLVDKNATQAALRAGYSPRTAEAIGRENIHKPTIANRIQKELDRQAVRIECSADKVIQEICKLAFVNAEELLDEYGKPKNIEQMPKNLTACISSLDFDAMTGKVTKIRLWDKKGALEMLARHFELLGDEKNKEKKDGDSYLLQIIDSFNGNGNGHKKLSPEEVEQISQVREVIQTNLRSEN